MLEDIAGHLVAGLPWLVVALFAALGLACVLGVALGLPGIWALLVLALVIELCDGAWLPEPAAVTFGWPALGLAAGLAIAGEALEALAGIAGTRLGGGSRRAMVGALVGGIAGAIVFTPLLPNPLVGTLIGAVLGTFLGAWLGEISAEHRRHPREQLRAAAAAAGGRLKGTLGKTLIAIVVWAVLVRAGTPG